MSNNTLKKAAVLTGLTVLMGGGALCPAVASEVHQFNFSEDGIGTPFTFAETLTFQQFNPSGGNLTGVTFSLDSNLSALPDSLIGTYGASIQVNGQTISSQNNMVGTYDNTNINGLVGGLSTAFYTGTGTFTVSLVLSCNACEGGISWDGNNANSTNPETGLTLSYITATPLPPALPLLATGLGGLGFAAWRNRRKQKPATEG